MKVIELPLEYNIPMNQPWSRPLQIKEKILEGTKIHAIVDGDKWKPIVDEVNAGKAILSVRYQEEEICTLRKAGWQPFSVGQQGNLQTFLVDGKEVGPATIAANEGLVVNDLYFWLGIWSGNFEGFEGGIIHFTEFRY